jgi:hypothetical protein
MSDLATKAMMAPKPAPARLTVTGMLYHQRPGHDARTLVEVRYGRHLKSEEASFQREMRLDEEWVALSDLRPLEPGDKAALLVVENLVGRDRRVIPTPDELADDARRVVEVGVVESGLVLPALEIPPGEAHPCRPVDVGRLAVRCRRGTAKARITVVPE